MVTLMAQSFTIPSLFDLPAIGVKGVFLGYAGIQALVCVFLFAFLKETKGLTNAEKKMVYAPIKTTSAAADTAVQKAKDEET